ncbi:BTAD domain-containing putative transcriptional regulator [Streptomyces sp. NPDC057052]|uniref:BTAD domain-containing putative transcriptional regulator n=1 Tax=Streptomyces sp. NPDC057052 TaxID=3346010 RepID=UPI00364144D8
MRTPAPCGRETGWALLLRALYLAGRHPEALHRYEEVRRHLADELGLDPGPELRALHHGILDHDLPAFPLPQSAVGALTASPPRRLVPSTGDGTFPASAPLTTGSAERPAPAGAQNPRSGPSHQPRPAQLPNDLAVFASRKTESAWALTAGRVPDRPGPGAARVVVIGGAAGVGKTTFAVHHAHHVAHLFPDGQLFVNLCGFHPRTPALDPGAARPTRTGRRDRGGGEATAGHAPQPSAPTWVGLGPDDSGRAAGGADTPSSFLTTSRQKGPACWPGPSSSRRWTTGAGSTTRRNHPGTIQTCPGGMPSELVVSHATG